MYEFPERRKRQRPADEEKVTRQSASAAECSQHITESVPKELQCVFSIDSPPCPLPSLPTPPLSYSQQLRNSATRSNLEIYADRSSESAFASPMSLRRDPQTPTILDTPKEVESFDGHGDLDPVERADVLHYFPVDPNLGWAISPPNFDFDVNISEASRSELTTEDEPMPPLSPSQSIIRESSFGSNGRLGSTAIPNPGSSKHISTVKKSPSGQSSACMQHGRCYGEASELLEKIEARKHDTLNYCIDGLLAFQKTVLSKCDELFRCRHCSSLSSFVMLLLYISDQVVEIFEHILDTGTVVDWRFSQQTQPSQKPITSSLNSAKRECVRAPRLRVSFGEYDCVSPCEWQVIARVLIQMQIQALRGSLRQYKDIASIHGWQTSTKKIIVLEERLKELLLRSQEWTHEGSSINNV